MNFEHALLINEFETMLPKQLQKDISIDFFVFNKYKYLLLEVNHKALPVSWFITDSNGCVIKNGNSSLSHSFINITSLKAGTYTIRLLGEKYAFKIIDQLEVN